VKKSRARLDAWAEVHKRFHLSDLPLQMARALGLNPKQCGGLANHWQEPWKLPLPEFIAECYRKRFHRERPAQVVPSPRSRSGTSNQPATRPDTHENAPTPDALQPPFLLFHHLALIHHGDDEDVWGVLVWGGGGSLPCLSASGVWTPSYASCAAHQ